MRIAILLVAACGSSHVAPAPSNTAPAPTLRDGKLVHALGERATERLMCVADNGGGEKVQDLDGHITKQTCAMIYDCSNGPGMARSATTGGAILACENRHCTCELTHDVPHRVDVYSFDVDAPCDRLETLFVANCSNIYPHAD